MTIIFASNFRTMVYSKGRIMQATFLGETSIGMGEYMLCKNDDKNGVCGVNSFRDRGSVWGQSFGTRSVHLCWVHPACGPVPSPRIYTGS